VSASVDEGPGYGEGKEALIRAVIRVVARNGLRNLTYRSVAAEAGVTHGLVAHHFGSRDALLEQALRYSLERSVNISMLEPGTGRLEDLAATLAEIVTADPDLQAFQFELTLEARRRPELRPHVVELYNRYRDAARRELARHGVHDPAIADVVFAALDGLVFQQISVTDEAATRAGVDRLHQLLKAYLTSGP
jgi:TetR/AcrR family transcriptional regulator, regulator of biofilm formation and stress response